MGTDEVEPKLVCVSCIVNLSLKNSLISVYSKLGVKSDM